MTRVVACAHDTNDCMFRMACAHDTNAVMRVVPLCQLHDREQYVARQWGTRLHGLSWPWHSEPGSHFTLEVIADNVPSHIMLHLRSHITSEAHMAHAEGSGGCHCGIWQGRGTC